MALGPEAETGIEIMYVRAVGHDELAAPIRHDRAIERRRGDRRGYWRQLENPFRQRLVVKRLHKISHNWRDDQRPNRWNGDRSRRGLERQGWECELKSCCGLAIFENLCCQRSADRERVQAGHACGRAEMQSFAPRSRSD